MLDHLTVGLDFINTQIGTILTHHFLKISQISADVFV